MFSWHSAGECVYVIIERRQLTKIMFAINNQSDTHRKQTVLCRVPEIVGRYLVLKGHGNIDTIIAVKCPRRPGGARVPGWSEPVVLCTGSGQSPSSLHAIHPTSK